MLGSDYCYDMGCERPLALLDELKISDGDRKLIAGGTAAKLLKI
jgi:aminocarboxymuconate-semialdehyde decarboxylase